MNRTPKQAGRGVVRNAGSSLAQLAVSTITLLILYRVVLSALGPKVFGVWSLVVAASSVVGLSNMGLSGSMVKHAADSQSAQDQHRLVGQIETTVVSVGALSILVALCGAPLMRLYFGATLVGPPYQSALDILPMALAAFCISVTTGIYQSALYGCHRIVERNAILIFESISFLVLSVILARSYGLPGLVFARALQNVITLLLSITVLKRHLPLLPWIPHHWNAAIFKGLMGYAVSYQFVGFLDMLMDPVTKGMLSRFGSLDMVTYFEMGSRVIGQVRAVIVNINQVLLPKFAAANRDGPEYVETLFCRSYEVIFYLAVCMFGVLAAATPLLCLGWLGGEHPVFVRITTILCVGWLVNTVTVPAYFASLGTGAMKSVVQSHMLMAFCNIVLGYCFGKLWGGYGVVGAWAIALAIGGLMLQVTYYVRNNLRFEGLLPPRGLRLLAFCALGLLVGYLATDCAQLLLARGLIAAAAAPIVFLVAFILPAIAHPVRADLVRWLTARRPI